MIENKQDIKHFQILPAPTEGGRKYIGIGEIYSM